jgi:hypothetical protein
MPPKTLDDLAARRKQLELDREARKHRFEDEQAHAAALLTLATGAATGAATGINAVRSANVDLAAKKTKAFAKSFAELKEAGLPAAAAYETASRIFGLEQGLDAVVSDAAGDLAAETRYLRQRMADVEKEAAALKDAMETENSRRATVAASFEDDEVGPEAVKHS